MVGLVKGKFKISFNTTGATYRYLENKYKGKGRGGMTTFINEAVNEKIRREKKVKP